MSELRQGFGSGTALRRAMVWLAAALVLVALPASVVVLGAGQQPDEEFPHEEHEGLFPVCTGCHAGIPAGDPQTAYPEPSECAECHDGNELDRVEWSGPSPSRPSNLELDHTGEFLEELGFRCEGCHSESREERMVVARGRSDKCLACHAPEAESHYSGPVCSECHVTLAASNFALDQIEDLPLPESHEREDFLGRIHGEQAAESTASCSTCHVRDRCLSCHVDTGRAELAAVPFAPEEMELPAYEAEYPTPASHLEADWLGTHSRDASRESCATCHTQDDCTTCHQGPPPAQVQSLPRRSGAGGPGVSLERRAPESHYAPAFQSEHGSSAAFDPAACATCHTEFFCTSCHGGMAEAELQSPEADEPVQATGALAVRPPGSDPGSESPGFHPPNYSVRHAADAWGQTLECASCHSTEVFCRTCHLESGIGSARRAGPGYHTAIPLWIFRHGQAARQGLESCASCHTETQCLRCHSSFGAFGGVSPHGPDFDPERARDRNVAVCFACHVTDPARTFPP